MIELPLEIMGVLGPVEVCLVEDLKDEDGVDCLGIFYPYLRRIAIRAGMPLALRWATLEHETVHVALFDVGVTLSDEHEESVADAIAAARVCAMRGR